MNSRIADLVEGDLTSALDANLRAFWSLYGRAPGNTLISTTEVTWFYTGIQVPLFNGVLAPHLSPDGVAATLTALQSRVDAQRAPALWWLGPDAAPHDLERRLTQHGLQPAGDVPGMAVDLGRLDAHGAAPPDATITKVTTIEMRAVWAHIAGAGSGFSPEATDALVRLETSVGEADYQTQQRYIGYWRGTPVSVSAMVVAAGVAGIYAVATLPEARRRGLGRWMTVAPLLEARQAGCRVGVLQASPMGYPVYQALGFVDVVPYRLWLQTPK